MTVRRSLSLRQPANQMPDAYFCVVWAKKNAERKARGVQELNFREARKELGFDAPPPGAVTLGSRGEDIRAFPGQTPEGTDTWYAQYQVSAKGILWARSAMLITNPSATSARPRRSTRQSLPVTAVGLRVDNLDKPRQEIELAGGVELRGK